MTSAQVVETSVNVISNSPSQDYTHPDDRTLLYDSLRLFSVDSSGRQMIRNFSLRQKLHLLLELLYGECDERMRQEIKCSMLLSLRFQICLLSSLEFLCLVWRNDAVWFLYLVLKLFSVSPMYVSVVLLSLRVTVAW